MITIMIKLTDVPYELDVQEQIDSIRLMLFERYGVNADIYINDVDLLNIIKLAQMS